MIWRHLWSVALLTIAVSACAGPLTPATPKTYRVGWLSGNTQAGAKFQVDAFLQGMRDLGYAEGRNLEFDIRYADGFADRDPALATELLALKCDVILARGVNEVIALKQATTSVPIVMAGSGTDPVADGLVASLAHPGGNVTGAIGPGAEVAEKRLQLLKDATTGSRVGYLYDASNPQQVREYQAAVTAARALGLELQPLAVRTPDDFVGAFAAADGGHPTALYVGGGPIMTSQRPKILDFITTRHLASMTQTSRDYVDGGALMYYADDTVATLARSASFVDKIFKGAKPGDLPIEAPSKYELIINLKTAKALGLTIPRSVLDQATEVIQ